MITKVAAFSPQYRTCGCTLEDTRNGSSMNQMDQRIKNIARGISAPGRQLSQNSHLKQTISMFSMHIPDLMKYIRNLESVLAPGAYSAAY